MNPYSQLLETIKKEKDFIDLTNTNFTTLTPLINFNKLQADLKSYLNNRKYEPDPKGLLSARNAISKYYKDKGFSIDPNNIIITASTSESYALIFSSLLKYEDRGLLPNPSYPLFSYLASYTRLKPLFYNLKEKVLDPFIENENFRRAIKDYDTEDFKTYGKRIMDDVTFLINNLCTKYRYTKQGAKEVCMYVIDRNLSKQFAVH